MTAVALLSPGTINFHFLAQRTGSDEGGRVLFEQLVIDVVGLQHPDVSSVEANPGDWGIDAWIGDMDGGSVSIWQSKYFINGIGESQQGQIRESYNSARTAASREGHTVISWTLCIPVSFDGPTSKWWAGWKKRMAKNHQVLIELWDETQLRRRLQSRDVDSTAVRDYYFSPVVELTPGGSSAFPSRPLQALVDASRFDDALFVRQMQEAKLTSTRAAREAFFNAEILGQEIADKGIPAEIATLQSWRQHVTSIWEIRFNDAIQQSAAVELPGLYRSVLERIEERHADAGGHDLGGTSVHGHGLMHQEVELGRAGWVRHWESVAADHLQRTGYQFTPNSADQAGGVTP